MNRTRLFSLGLSALVSALASRPLPAQIDTTLARSYFDEIRTAGDRDTGSLWRRRIDGPLLFVDPGSREVIANEADAEGLLARHGAVWIGKLPASLNPANTAVTLGGKRFAMVMWPVPDNRYSRLRLLMHESFHRIQDSLGLPMGNPSNSHLASFSGRVWTRLEWRALTEALLRDGAARTSALRDALTFRARRHALSHAAADEERQLELNEGLSEYTGLMLSGLPRAVLRDRAAMQLGQQEQQESFVRNFAYVSGPAYALLLDAAGGDWRRSLRASSDLARLAGAAYSVTADPRVDSSILVARYSGERMIATERNRETARAAQEARVRSVFLDGPTLTLPVGGKFSFSFDPNGATVLPGVGIVYQTSRITDDWGALDVTSGGVLMLRRDDGNITGLVVPRPVVAQGAITGEGWKLDRTPGWTAREDPAKKDSFTLIPPGGD